MIGPTTQVGRIIRGPGDPRRSPGAFICCEADSPLSPPPIRGYPSTPRPLGDLPGRRHTRTWCRLAASELYAGRSCAFGLGAAFFVDGLTGTSPVRLEVHRTGITPKRRV